MILRPCQFLGQSPSKGRAVGRVPSSKRSNPSDAAHARVAPAGPRKGSPSPMDKIADLRRFALEERALVETCALAHVRAKHELAAVRWDDLADQAERATAAHLA